MLDRTKPYGVVCGALAEAPTARYEQDGQLFDQDGCPLMLEPVPDAAVEDADASGEAPRRGPGRPRKVDA